MSSCSSSLDLPLTRTASPWIWPCSLGNSSRMSLLILLGHVLRQALPQAGPLPEGHAAGRLHLAPVEDLDRETPPDGLADDEVRDGRRAHLRVGDDDELLLGQVDLDLGALEVEAGGDLATHLVDGVDQLLAVELADDVERDVTGHPVPPRVRRHCRSPRWAPDRPRRGRPARCASGTMHPVSSSSRGLKPRSRARAAARPTRRIRRVPAGQHGATGDPDALGVELDVELFCGDAVPVRADGQRLAQRRLEGIGADLGVRREELHHRVRVALLASRLEAGEHILPVTGRQVMRHSGILPVGPASSR